MSSGDGRVSLVELGAHWRVAFSTAEEALAAAGACGKSLRFEVGDLTELRSRLARERAIVTRLLDLVAGDEHVEVRAAARAATPQPESGAEAPHPFSAPRSSGVSSAPAARPSTQTGRPKPATSSCRGWSSPASAGAWR